jgi:hypothetical protein
MTFKKTFCSSPWIHMRINNSGTYEFCRWQRKNTSITRVNQEHNIYNISPAEYFQNSMSPLRAEILTGDDVPGCRDCYTMEEHVKVSGRQRQLLKTGVMMEHFDKSLLSSPYLPDFEYSNQNQGKTTRMPVDWQIDLGNYCNSACVFCSVENSSRLATEFKKIGLISKVPSANWCENPVLLDKFLTDLTNSPDVRYLHFIGGETIITPAFETILRAVIDSGKSKTITVGFTTNLTVWSENLIELLKQFEQINVGLSIETLTPVNDYVRYPSKLDQTMNYLSRWIETSREQNWLTQLRITPTCLTIHDITTVYDYAWKNQLSIESCNFLYNPEFMRITVLPMEQRMQAIDKLQTWLNQYQDQYDTTTVITNTRDPNLAREQILQDAQSYIGYLRNANDESFRLPALVNYLHKLEGNRNNSILDYIPEYEQLFRSHGY